MSLMKVAQVPVYLGFPRVSGDEPKQIWAAGAALTFSPRERG